MKTKLPGLVLSICLAMPAFAQPDMSPGYRNFPIIVTLQFHAFTLPFRDIKAHFGNVGIGLGTEIGLNGKPSLIQQVSAVWYRNRTVGNGLLLMTQTAWRPALTQHVYTELKAGVGYLISFRPVASFRPVGGGWVAAGHKGRGLFAVPVGVSVGYNNPVAGTYLSPFVSYQFMLAMGYNKDIPLVPQTFFQVGSRIHP